MEAGKLVPDSIIIELIKQRIKLPDAVNGVMFDGFLRTVYAEALSEITDVTHVIAIEVPDERIVDRICGDILVLVAGWYFRNFQSCS